VTVIFAETMVGLHVLGALLVPPSAEPQDDAPKPLARRLVEQEMAGTNEVESAATSLLVERVYESLARWFGPYGALALVTRAIARARPEHPILAHVVVNATSTPHVTGWPNGITAEDAVATTDAAVAVISVLHETLTRLIGDDLAETLLAQSDVLKDPSTTEMPISPNASDA